MATGVSNGFQSHRSLKSLQRVASNESLIKSERSNISDKSKKEQIK